MKQMKRVKPLLMVAMIAILLTATIGGTIAWLATKTDPVVNTFTPAEVKTEIEEEFDNDGAKKAVKIENQGSIPVYVRVAIAGHWVNNKGEIVDSWTLDVDEYINETNWIVGNDGFFYYNGTLAAGATTENLLKKSIAAETTTDKHLEVTVIQQSIQAEPVSVVQTEWNVTLSGKNIVSQP